MAEKLKQLLFSENKVERIISELPKRTAVKVIAALKELRQSILQETTRDVAALETTYFKRKDSYLMALFNELKNNPEKYENTLKSDISHHLLIVICEDGISTEDEKYYEKLVKATTIPKKVIVISSEGDGIKDDLKFTDFSNVFKKTLLSKKVSFQGATLAVADLIKTQSDQTVDELIQSGEPEKIFDLDSIEELIKQEKSQIQIPSLSSSRFEKSLYIKRQLSSAFPFDNEFWEEVAKQLDMETSGGYSLEKLQRECEVNKQGEIKWKAPIVNDEEKTKIWKKMIGVIEKRKSLTVLRSNTRTEDNLSIHRHEKETFPPVVIIAGVAGSGKSSILSHYYEEIKEKDPKHWVIIINFTDHSKELFKLNTYKFG
jgi:Tfp pilus assembly pilus retraction ATPase PilT